jgi:hypothetical protein
MRLEGGSGKGIPPCRRRERPIGYPFVAIVARESSGVSSPRIQRDVPMKRLSREKAHDLVQKPSFYCARLDRDLFDCRGLGSERKQTFLAHRADRGAVVGKLGLQRNCQPLPESLSGTNYILVTAPHDARPLYGVPGISDDPLAVLLCELNKNGFARFQRSKRLRARLYAPAFGIIICATLAWGGVLAFSDNYRLVTSLAPDEHLLCNISLVSPIPVRWRWRNATRK